MPARRNWTRNELLLALRLYMRVPFGLLHQHNPEIIALASQIGRTPSAVAMKACNFASLDPALEQTGLSSTSRADRAVWQEFADNPESLAHEAEAASESVIPAQAGIQPTGTDAPIPPDGPTDAVTLVRTRRVQSFFRAAVLTSYDNRCALTGLAVPSLLVASHIIPWSESVPRRADPTNGLCLSALFDRAFDRGLVTFDKDLRLVLSRNLKDHLPAPRLPCLLTAAEGQRLELPTRFAPDSEALAFHRESVFDGSQQSP